MMIRPEMKVVDLVAMVLDISNKHRMQSEMAAFFDIS